MDLTLDATLAHLTKPATMRMPYRLPFRRGPAVVRGLTLNEICQICDRHEAVRDGIWLLFGLSRVEGYERTERDARALLDIVQIGLGSSTLLTLARVTRLPVEVFASTVEAIVRLTVPADVEHLFEPTDGKSGPDGGQQGPWNDPSVVLTKLALRLDPKGSCLDWTPGRLLFTASTLNENDAAIARTRLLNAAVAARLGQADEKGWKRGIADLSKG